MRTLPELAAHEMGGYGLICGVIGLVIGLAAGILSTAIISGIYEKEKKKKNR